MTALRAALFAVLLGCGGTVPDPTPPGPVGVPVALLEPLPSEVAGLDPDRAYGHVLDLGARGHGAKLRVLTWTARPAGEPLAAAVGVEVRDNPGGTVVTWSVIDPSPAAPRLDIRVVWRTPGSDHELVVTGRIDPAAATFVAD